MIDNLPAVRRLAQEMHVFSSMSTNDDSRANQKRREQAARIIMDNEQRKRAKQTDELLLDREALRQASIRAGLEKPDNH